MIDRLNPFVNVALDIELQQVLTIDIGHRRTLGKKSKPVHTTQIGLPLVNGRGDPGARSSAGAGGEWGRLRHPAAGTSYSWSGESP